MKIHSVSRIYNHFFPAKTEHIKVVEVKDETGKVIETDILQYDMYDRKGKIQNIVANGSNVNELL